MLNIWASQQQGVPAPSPPAPFATADFKNGVYTLEGVPCTFDDLFVSPTDQGAITHDPATIIAGTGWQISSVEAIVKDGFKMSAALLALTQYPVGCSTIATLLGSQASLQYDNGDSPDWVLGWTGLIHQNGVLHARVLDYFGIDDTNSGIIPSGKVGVTLSKDNFATAVGGVLKNSGPPDPASYAYGPDQAFFWDIHIQTPAITASITVENLEFYPPLTNGQLRSLSV